MHFITNTTTIATLSILLCCYTTLDPTFTNTATTTTKTTITSIAAACKAYEY